MAEAAAGLGSDARAGVPVVPAAWYSTATTSEEAPNPRDTPAERGTQRCGVNLATASRATFRPNPSANLVGSAKVWDETRTGALGELPRAFWWPDLPTACRTTRAPITHDGEQHGRVADAMLVCAL